MKISILTIDISHNCLYRSYSLAKLLQKKYDVEIIGPCYQDSIWPPLKNIRDIPIKSVKTNELGTSYNWKLLLKIIDGDIIYACKPHFATLGIGLMAKYLKHKPLILDIDDYELGFGKEVWDRAPWYRKLLSYRKSLHNFRSYQWVTIINRLTRFADAITVSSIPLQQMYGGTLIRQPINTDVPVPIIKGREPVIGFIGTIRKHKGVDQLIKALMLLRYRKFKCVLTDIGNDRHINHLKALVEEANMKNKIMFISPQLFTELNNVLAYVDIVVIPQSYTLPSKYQVPAKLFDAMNMGKMIVATNVGDISNILGDGGIIVDPDDLFQLTLVIDYAMSLVREDKAYEKYGSKARERCKQYDVEKIRRKLNKVVRSVI